MDQVLGNLDAGNVLDVATGNGSFIELLISNLRSYKTITGVDSQSNHASGFAENFVKHPEVRFVTMDASDLQFPDHIFDTVSISNSLHHLPDMTKVLNEMMRVLKPGGNFILQEMFRDQQSNPQMTHVLLHHWWAQIDSALGITHFETFTKQEILAILDGLRLSPFTWIDICDFSEDPLNPETIQLLDEIIDRYTKRAESIPQAGPILEQGKLLRDQLHRIGFQNASAILAVGQKPMI